MVQASHQGTRNIPLKLAEAITAVIGEIKNEQT